MDTPNLITKLRLPLTIIIVLLLGYYIVTIAVNERLSDLKLQTEVLIAEQATRLSSIAEVTARNGADAITEQIIKDCSLAERNRFDDLLGRLNRGLTSSELNELERLFGRCGSFFSARKAVMVARLQREYEIYKTYVTQLENLSGKSQSDRYNIIEWEQLSSLEVKQSELFSELVRGQDEIITTLLSGKSPTSPEIASILERVQGTQGTLLVTNAQARDVRTSLISL